MFLILNKIYLNYYIYCPVLCLWGKPSVNYFFVSVSGYLKTWRSATMGLFWVVNSKTATNRICIMTEILFVNMTKYLRFPFTFLVFKSCKVQWSQVYSPSAIGKRVLVNKTHYSMFCKLYILPRSTQRAGMTKVNNTALLVRGKTDENWPGKL